MSMIPVANVIRPIHNIEKKSRVRIIEFFKRRTLSYEIPSE